MCDGGGLVINRMIGSKELETIDPFLLLDELKSNNPQDFQMGFPEHAHRGMQLVTYMIQGDMLHTDSMGHSQLLKTGDVQWILAGSGMTHSEMPIFDQERHQRFWLIHYWVNLTKNNKMIPSKYQYIPSSLVPYFQNDLLEIKVISGTFKNHSSPVENIDIVPQVLDITFTNTNSYFEFTLQHDESTLFLVLNGSVMVDQQLVEEGQLIVFHNKNNNNSQIKIVNSTTNSNSDKNRIFFFSSKRIDEPIVRFGPFVMNTQQELHKCFIDFEFGC
ncbi:hypothetical protein CYY_006648 [Polysphondylium violaceum]|uniref:Pirin family protein n=1 Tax=Polysphondylium violaceum TaxID=133409 RepID=A0A8J4PRL1_9MYCE|nr:hypothetical protein CYY_006648 [Polysphondylium violaceum]